MFDAYRDTGEMRKAFGPTADSTHIDSPLSNLSVAYFQGESGFVADKVFPIVRVMKQSDIYWKFDPDEFNRDEMQPRGDATESAGGGFGTNTDSYRADVVAYHKDIGAQLEANMDPEVDLEQLVDKFLTLKYKIHLEKKFVTDYFSTGVWAKDVAGVDGGSAEVGDSQCIQWDDADSNPIEVLKYWKRYMREQTGFEPNTLVLTRDVKDALSEHPEFIDRVKYGQTAGGPARATIERIQELLEIENLHIMEAIENVAKKGATRSHQFIAKQKALLCYSNPTPARFMPSAGYIFTWNYAGITEGQGQAISILPVPLKKANRYEIEAAYDMKQVGSDLGIFFSNLVGSGTPNA